jgi:hypothetical protein
MTIMYAFRLEQPTMTPIKKTKVKHVAWLMTKIIDTKNNCLRIKACPLLAIGEK